jgi:hypothetical protein
MSFFVPEITVFIGNLKEFSKVHKVRVMSGWREITDTCRIWMPRNIRVKQDDSPLTQLPDVIKKGDPVMIVAGYKPNKRVEFRGFVRLVKKNIPIEIECEDYGYLLTLDTFNKSWKGVTLRQLVNEIIAGPNLKAYTEKGFDFDLEVLDQNLKDAFDFTAKDATPLQILLKLREQFAITTYFKTSPHLLVKPTLVVGFSYTGILQLKKPILRTGLNVIDWNLEYRLAEDVRLRLKGIINRKNGQKQVFEVGDPDGVVQTRNFDGSVTEAMARASLEKELTDKKYDGFYGTLSTFGKPYIRHSDTIVIDDPIYTQEKGRYRVEATEWVFTEEPRITRTLTMGEKVSE